MDTSAPDQLDTDADLAQELSNVKINTEIPPELDGEKAIVSPRAFRSPMGYDVGGERLSWRTARVLIDRERTVKLVDCVRGFNSSWEEGYEETRDMFEKKGYNQMRVYRVDHHSNDDATDFEAWGNGGFLFEYQYPRGEHERQAHAGVGYYSVPTETGKALLHDMLRGEGEQTPSWTRHVDRDRAAAHESWHVVEYTADVYGKSDRQLFEDALIDPRGSPEPSQ